MKLMTALMFGPNPTHYDKTVAESVDLERLVNQGEINMSSLLQVVTVYLEDVYQLRDFSVRFENNVFEGGYSRPALRRWKRRPDERRGQPRADV